MQSTESPVDMGTMEAEKSRSILQRLFIGFAIAGLVINFTADLLAFSENRVSDEVDLQLHKTMKVSMRLESLGRTLITPATPLQIKQIQMQIAELHDLNLPMKSPSLADLQSQLTANPAAARDILFKLQEGVTKSSLDLQNASDEQNVIVDRRMIWTLIFDFVLIGIMLTLFIFNTREKRKVEKTLKQTLYNMRETLLALEEQSNRRHISTKSIVHDLKNPIGTIMGFAQALQDSASSEMTVVDFSDRIRKISERSLALVETLLKEDDLKSAQEPVNFSSLVKNTCANFYGQAMAKKQIILSDIQTTESLIQGNQIKLEELVSNILSNALKYSPQNSEIRVTLKNTGSDVQLIVEDQGPGFTDQDRRDAFQFGKKLSAKPTHGESSTGFGLFITKQIIEDHHGRIEIANAANKQGARILVTLPLLATSRSLVTRSFE